MHYIKKSDVSLPEVALSKIPWDFDDSLPSRNNIHSFHSYPARFIPEIPRSFIEALKPPAGTRILDPFCGCGTTLVEAVEAGFSAVGIDLNPIACLISKIKTAQLPPDLVSTAKNCVEDAKIGLPPILPEIPNLAHWFQVEVSETIARLLRSMAKIENDLMRDCLRACLSSIIVKISNQESDTRYAAVEKQVTATLVYKLFENAVVNLASLKPCKHGSVKIINKNIYEVSPTDIGTDVSLVITSPPYPNAYEYWLYHKYRMWWLDYDPLKVKFSEIGARAHFFTKRRETEDFAVQMEGVFKLLSQVMIKNGYCCFICGDSKIGGNIVDNSLSLLTAAAKYGYKLVFKSDRALSRVRKSFNLHHARIKREHVLVWQK